MVTACLALGVSSYPSNNEEATTLTLDLLKESLESIENENEQRSLPEEQILVAEDDNTKAIIEKIKAINDGLKRPNRRPQINWNTQPSTGGSYTLDKEILEKLQQIIASDAGSYQTKQNPTSPSLPSLPFQFQWPFASFFPLLIRDPLLSILNGGGWSNFIEYGQMADVCNRKQKSLDDENIERNDISTTADVSSLLALDPAVEYNSRKARAIKKRTVSQGSIVQELDNAKNIKKVVSLKPNTTRKPLKEDNSEDTKTSGDGSLRFPFGDFTWFGNKKPVSPTPGFFINRLKVRKGGVAIAGPGGVATAGRGGAAIVGPGGLAYTQPGGLAVAGPAARVVALSPEIDLSSVVTRLQEQAATDGSVPHLLKAIPEGKVVATGPVVYYHSNSNPDAI
ncbi:hypothetical protein O3G_MSEX000036 [Manduca sexta]|nr:hypothetical protein O3G_MSEX000036 [Manduca sexta]